MTLTNENDRALSVFGISSTTQHNLVVGVWRISGVDVFRVTYYNDAGQQFDTSSLSCTQNAWVTITVHWKAATAAGANNGVVQAWVDGTSLVSLTNVDSDTLTSNAMMAGDRFGTNDPGTIQVDDAQLSQYPTDANLWRATLDGAVTASHVVIGSTTLGVSVASAAACVSANQWYHDTAGDLLFLYATADPDNTTVEASQRPTVITVNAKNYATIDGLTLDMANNVWPSGAVYATGTSSNLTIQNNLLRWGARGIYFYNGTSEDALVYANTIHSNSLDGIGSGIFSGSSGHEIVVRGNTVYNNGSDTGDAIHVRGNYWIVEQNTVRDNGATSKVDIGIHVYTAEDDSEGVGTYNIIRRNIVYNQKGSGEDGSGIETDTHTHHNQIYYNVVYNCDGPGIDIYDSHHVDVWNNVSYGNMQDSGVGHATFAELRFISSVHDLTANLSVKNNIAYATKANTYAIFVDAATANNAGLDITNNDWYRASGNWYSWDGTPGAVLATWNALTGVGTDLNADPLFVSTATPNFRLQSTSPGRNAGVDVGLTADIVSHKVPLGAAPDCGAYEWGGFMPLWIV